MTQYEENKRAIAPRLAEIKKHKQYVARIAKRNAKREVTKEAKKVQTTRLEELRKIYGTESL